MSPVFDPVITSCLAAGLLIVALPGKLSRKRSGVFGCDLLFHARKKTPARFWVRLESRRARAQGNGLVVQSVIAIVSPGRFGSPRRYFIDLRKNESFFGASIVLRLRYIPTHAGPCRMPYYLSNPSLSQRLPCIYSAVAVL